jgi:hypothetical protein
MSALTLDRLAFDPAAAADGPSIGSYINTVTGGVIDSTDVSGTDGLNVNVLNDIAVELDQANDSVAIGDGTTLFGAAVEDVAAGSAHAGFASMAVQDAVLSALGSVDGDFTHLRTNANGAVWMEFVNSSIAVTATDLDIRDLAFATDKVDVSGSEVSLDAATLAALETITVLQGTSPWVVSATDLDIRDLSHSQDSVKIGDGTDFLAVNADGSINVAIGGGVADDAADSGNPLKIGYRAHDASAALGALSADGDRADALSDLYRRVFINDAPNISALNAAVSVDTTAGGIAIPATPLAGRTRLIIQNNGDKSIFVGTGTVTAANGIEIGKGGALTLEAGEALAYKAIAASGTQDIRIMEQA